MNSLTDKNPLVNLIADIGGTNIRIGLSDENNKISQLELYKSVDYSGLEEIIQYFLQARELTAHKLNVCIAVAGPVESDLISLTNLPWIFSKKHLKKYFNFNRLIFINDYSAIAFAVPFLCENQKIQIGGGQAVPDGTISVCGPGTGLGVSSLLLHKEELICINSEGGHTDFAPLTDIEQEIRFFLLKKHSRISYEKLLSGKGLEQIYQALLLQDNKNNIPLCAEEITHHALNSDSVICQQALTIFCNILGSFAGNLALTMMSTGGVYIAGGIVPRFIDFLKNTKFRERFEAKGRLENFNKNIPVFIIQEKQPGLLGASVCLSQQKTDSIT